MLQIILIKFTYNKIIANYYEIYSEFSSFEKKYSSKTIMKIIKKYYMYDASNSTFCK